MAGTLLLVVFAISTVAFLMSPSPIFADGTTKINAHLRLDVVDLKVSITRLMPVTLIVCLDAIVICNRVIR